MKTAIWKNRWTVVVLGLLGFPGCSEVAPPPPVAYGPAPTSFRIKGHVTDPEGNPIQGISVRNISYEQTSATDEEGRYDLSFGQMSDEYKLLFTDPDGPANGGDFLQRQVEGRFTDTDRDPNEYDYIKTLDVMLEPKTPVGQ